MTRVPQTLADETVDALNALIDGSDRFRDWNAFEIQTLVRAIEKLRKVDAKQAFARLGALAAICGNVDGALEYYRKALLLPGEAETKHEFWVSLGNAGLYAKAREIGSWLLEPKRGFFSKVWQAAVSLGQLLEVWHCLPEAKKTYPDLSQIDFSVLEDAVGVMETHGLSDQAIVSVLDLMGEIQRAHRIMFSGKLVTILKIMRPPEDPAYLYLTIPLDIGVEEIHAMNRDLAGLVVARLPEGTFPQGMVATFSRAHLKDLRAAA